MSIAASSLDRVPPAPTPNEAPLGFFAGLRALRRNPITTWTRAHYELPVLYGRSLLGQTAVVNDPAAVRRVFLDNVANYRKDDLQLRILAPGLGRGLLTAEGETWRAQRRALAPLFTPRMVAGFAPAMRDAADALVARWERKRDGQCFDVAPEMGRVTLNVLERTIFSDGLGGDPEAVMEAVTRYFDTIGRIDPLDVFGFPDWIPRISRLRARPALAFFDASVDRLIAQRRAQLAERPGSAPQDLLTHLLNARDPETGRGLPEAEVRANIVTFIGAGHETTANTLTWTLFLLAMAPDWRARVEAEVDAAAQGDWLAAGAIDRLVVTRAVIEEALRLYPPAATLMRAAIASDELAGQRIRAGDIVVVSPWLLHRHKRLWTRPDAFDPTRFLPGAREGIDRYAYLPFGAGPRVCIGMGFALQEAIIVLATMARRFRLDMQAGVVVEPVQRVTLRPKDGLPMILRRR